MQTLNEEIKRTEELVKYTRKSLLKNKHLKELKRLMYYKEKYPENDYLLNGLIIGDSLKSIHERLFISK